MIVSKTVRGLYYEKLRSGNREDLVIAAWYQGKRYHLQEFVEFKDDPNIKETIKFCTLDLNQKFDSRST